jgi:hypothetical protein
MRGFCWSGQRRILEGDKKMGWKIVTPEHIEFHDFAQGPLEGEYIGKLEGVGKNSGTVYQIATSDGIIKGLWSSAVIDDQFSRIQEGTRIRVTYIGLIESKTSGRQYKMFEVAVWEDEKDYGKKA